MSDTPETEAILSDPCNGFSKIALHAIRLERERDEARRTVRMAHEEGSRISRELTAYSRREAVLLKACDDSGGTLSVEFVRGIINQRRAEG